MNKSEVFYDGHEVLFSEGLIFNEGKEVKIKIFDDDQIVISFLFRSDSESNESKPEVVVVPEGEGAIITFLNWNSALGTALTEPMKVGKDRLERHLFIHAFAMKVGSSAYSATVQVMREMKR